MKPKDCLSELMLSFGFLFATIKITVVTIAVTIMAWMAS